MQVRVQSAVQMARSQMRMENLKAMHIKRFVAHLLTFRHTVYYRIWFFCRPFRRTGREHHKTSDKPPPAGVGSRDGLLYVYHTADCSPLWCVIGCAVLYRTRKRPLPRFKSLLGHNAATLTGGKLVRFKGGHGFRGIAHFLAQEFFCH